MFLVLRKMGVKKSILSRSAITDPSSRNNFVKSSGQSGNRSEGELLQSKKDAAGTFYRLPDDNISGETANEDHPVDVELRPDHGYAYTVTSKPGKDRGGSLAANDIPLHGIRVDTDFKQSAS